MLTRTGRFPIALSLMAGVAQQLTLLKLRHDSRPGQLAEHTSDLERLAGRVDMVKLQVFCRSTADTMTAEEDFRLLAAALVPSPLQFGLAFFRDRHRTSIGGLPTTPYPTVVRAPEGTRTPDLLIKSE